LGRGCPVPRWLQRSLFAALVILALGAAIEAELQEAKIYNQAQPAAANSQNNQSSGPTAVLGDPQKTEKGKQESYWYDTFLNHPTDWLLVLFNCILATFTARLFYATDKQSTEMQASIKAAVDSAKAAITSNQIAVVTSEQELRAYVTASSVNFIYHRQPGRWGTQGNFVDGPIHTYAVAAILKNGGQTPALNVRINASCQKLSAEAIVTTDFPDSVHFGYGVIGPDGELHTPLIRISAQDFEPIEASIDWYLWGWIEYDDVFTQSSFRHRTEFCFHIDRVRLQPTNELWIGFSPYSRFNAIDGGCVRPFNPHENTYG
jgi:hypothetical protein